ncbi:MAG: hypothetical protein ABL921_11235 [Pirellula sp.]
MNRKIWLAVLIPAVMTTSVLLGVMRLNGNPQQSKKNQVLDSFMRLKLEHSKLILEGLATEDYEMISKGAQALTALSLESAWNVYTTEEYLKKSTDFRRSIQLIKDAAHEENVDRATLGYVNLTVQCIECHRYLRKKVDSDAASNK